MERLCIYYIVAEKNHFYAKTVVRYAAVNILGNHKTKAG